MGAAGPFDHWPQAWGFDHWWGFLTGAAGQYDPIITQDNSVLGVPEGKDGPTTSPTTSPTRPSSGCTRCAPRTRTSRGSSTTPPAPPMHRTTSPSEWADKYKGQFDDGWDVPGETLERQKKLGIVPPRPT
jgi:arylsulfatase A-like enzyme